MPKQSWVMVEVTDQYGHVESEMALVEAWPEVARMEVDGKQVVFPDADQLRAALEPRREIREQAA